WGTDSRTAPKPAPSSLPGTPSRADGLPPGRGVALVFAPFALADIEARSGGRSFGQAVAFRVGRHAHPKARPEQPSTAAPATGIDYLALIGATHDSVLAERINYTALISGPDPAPAAAPGGQPPGQMTLDQALGGNGEGP